MKKIIINTDGGSRGNPGQAAAGFVIQSDEGKLLASDGICLGIATNNEAEYSAVKFALERLIKDFNNFLPVNVEIRADSTLVVNQLEGKFKIKNERLRIFINEIKQLENKIGQVRYTYIPREQNSQADYLVNSALDARCQ